MWASERVQSRSCGSPRASGCLAARGEPPAMPAGKPAACRLIGARVLGLFRVDALGAAPALSPKRGLDSAGRTRGFSDRAAKHAGELQRWRGATISTSLTCAVLPTGDLHAAGAAVQPGHSGLGVRLRRVPLGRTSAGRPSLMANTIMTAVGGEARSTTWKDLPSIATVPAVVLTLVSDDNFSMLQRTILLQFRMDEAAGLQRVAG